MATVPCRLTVFLARKAPVGVVLRRGPKRWAQLVGWDRATDTFTPGQWFRGRVYERRCDLSPDGRLFVYFAAKHGPRRDPDGIGEAWTAISRPPFFTALALWPNLGSWYGGGVFKTDRSVLLDAMCSVEPHPKFRVKRLKVGHCPAKSAPWEQRMLNGGWQLVERGFDPRTERRVGPREIWKKAHPKRPLTLHRQMHEVDFSRPGGSHHETIWLETADDLLQVAGARWADWDGDRLVFSRAGALWQAVVEDGALAEKQLFDFNPLRPKEITAPGWARQW